MKFKKKIFFNETNRSLEIEGKHQKLHQFIIDNNKFN